MTLSLWQLKKLMAQVSQTYVVSHVDYALTIGGFLLSEIVLIVGLIKEDENRFWGAAMINFLIFLVQIMLIIIFNKFVTMASRFNSQKNSD